jgi:EAL and modified HD-GYP domain-containing signal transduction protein
MNQCFVTRKPLLDRYKNIAAYEVLFRDMNGLRPDVVPTLSPGEALAVFLSTNSFRQLTGEKLAVVSLGPDLVKDHITALIPKDKTVLGVSDGDPLTNAVLMEQCKALRQRGYRFCLNDFKHEESFSPFLPLAEFVQISMAGNDRAKIAENVSLLKKLSAKLLASDVNSEEEYNYCLNLGFDLFKGSFYHRSCKITPKSISPSQLLLLELSAYLARDEDMHTVEGIFKKNPELTFGLLKLINSAFFRVQQKVTSIRQAIALLGYGNLQKWVGLLLFTIDHRDHTFNPLTEKVLVRGRIMELLAERVTGSKTVADSAFITGILSFVNVLFGKPLQEIIDKLSLALEIRDALLQRAGVLGTLLAITEDLDDENYGELEQKFSAVGIRSIDLLSIETKAILEYQTSVNDDLRKLPQGKEANQSLVPRAVGG